MVSLKKIQIFEIMDSKIRNDCINEVKILQSLDHPNVVKYIDSFIEVRELPAQEWIRYPLPFPFHPSPSMYRSLTRNDFMQENELVIVLEWAERGDLKGLLKERREKVGQLFTESEIWVYFGQVRAFELQLSIPARGGLSC